MVKAEELIREQLAKDKLKKESYKKVYKKLEKKIIQSSAVNLYYCWNDIPEFIINTPLYSLNDCKIYLSEKLKKNGFTFTMLTNTVILVSWNK